MQLSRNKFERLRVGQYCWRCFREGIKTVESSRGHVYYRCVGCGFRSSRRLEINSKRRMEWTEKGIRHFGSGAFIWRHGKILLIRRTFYPFSYATPGGHMDRGEKPLETLRREIREETGLRLKNVRLIYHEELPGDRCRKGGDRHVWWLYSATGVGRIRGSKESTAVRWFSRKQLSRLPLTYCTRYLLRKFKLLK